MHERNEKGLVICKVIVVRKIKIKWNKIILYAICFFFFKYIYYFKIYILIFEIKNEIRTLSESIKKIRKM